MRTAILFLILVFLIDMLGFYLGSVRPDFYDMALHLSGGFFVAMFFLHYFKDLAPGNPGSPKLKKAFIIVSAVIFVGVMWEMVEYIATKMFGEHLYETYRIICCMGDLDDTVNDLAMDILGAAAFVFLNDISSIKPDLSDYKKYKDS